MGKAVLLDLKRGFGGDSYDYSIDPPLGFNGATWSAVRINVGWGLLAPMVTSVYVCRDQEVVSYERWQEDQRIDQLEALRRLGYVEVPPARGS